MRTTRLLILTWFLLFAQALPISAQQNPESVAPLDNLELREILLRLQQLPLAWTEIDLRIQAEVQMQQLFERERDLAARELEMERQRTAIATRETQIEKERADFYQTAYETVTRKPSWGCRLRKIFTIGLARCG